MASTCLWMQVDLLVFDAPKDNQAVCEEHMTSHKGVWSHQVSPALSRWRFQIMQNVHKRVSEGNLLSLLIDVFLTTADRQDYDITVES